RLRRPTTDEIDYPTNEREARSTPTVNGRAAARTDCAHRDGAQLREHRAARTARFGFRKNTAPRCFRLFFGGHFTRYAVDDAADPFDRIHRGTAQCGIQYGRRLNRDQVPVSRQEVTAHAHRLAFRSLTDHFRHDLHAHA